MTEMEKRLQQAKHRLEEAEARDRKKERNARTRRLIQEGAILESVFPQAQYMDMIRSAKEKMQDHFGRTFRPDLMRRAEADVKESLPNDERSLWRYQDQKRRKEREAMRQRQGQKPQKRDYER